MGYSMLGHNGIPKRCPKFFEVFHRGAKEQPERYYTAQGAKLVCKALNEGDPEGIVLARQRAKELDDPVLARFKRRMETQRQ